MKFKILLTAFLLLINHIVNAQNAGQRVVFPSPQSAQLGKFGGFKLNHSTGLPSINIPIYTATEGKLQIPISLSYFYSGYRPSDMPTWVGMGWTLNAGGSISRTVKGTADEIVVGQATKIKALVDDAFPTAAKYNDLGLNNNDYGESEPDLFSFQFGGLSGKFVLDENSVPRTLSASKIQFAFTKSAYGPDNRQVITKWEATAEDGTKYTFNAFDVSFREENAMYIFPSSWYLTEILSPKGDKIILEYSSKDDNKKRVQVSLFEQSTAGSGTSSVNYNFSREIYLQRISGSNWEVNFESSEYLAYIGQYTSSARKLDAIKIRNTSQNSDIKEFSFAYKDVSQVKLTLENVREVGTPPFSFTYDGGVIGRDVSGLSRQIDTWGFYNGTNNITLLPSEPTIDLFPRLAQTKIGALTQITYPTGGSSSFEYELNEYSFVGTVQTSNSKVQLENYSFYFRRFDNIGVLQHNSGSAFTLTQPTRVDIRLQAGPSAPSNCTGMSSDNFQSFQLPAGSYSGDDLLKRSNFIPCNQIWGPCTDPGDPCGFFPPDGYDVALSVKVYKVYSSGRPDAGGLRILKMTDSPQTPGGPNVVRDYSYNMESNSSLSSGAIQREPIYDVTIPLAATSSTTPSFPDQLRVVRSSAFNPTSLTPVSYREVMESNGETKDRYYFIDYFNKSDSPGKWSAIFDVAPSNQAYLLINNSQGHYELGEFENYDFIRGLQKKFESKDMAGNLKTKTVTDYNVESSPNRIKGFYHDYLASYFGVVGSTETNGTRLLYFGKAYEYAMAWPRKISEENTIYGTDGNASTVMTNYEYGNTDHLQLTKQRTSQSDGFIRETNFKYPLDYKDTPGKASFIQGMIDANMVNYTIENTVVLEKSSADRKVIDANLTTYKSFSGNANKANLLLPYKIFKFNGFNGSFGNSFNYYSGTTDETASSSYREDFKFSNYDSNGNPLSTLVKNADKISYVWGYKGQHPVAEITNADYNEVNTALSVSGTSFDAMSNNNNSGDIRTKINSVRNNLTTALVTGYSYKPLVGIESSTDPSGKVTWYNYDNFNRLSEIREDNSGGNLLQSFHYNYANAGFAGPGISGNPDVSAPSNPGLITGGGGCTPPPTLSINANGNEVCSTQSVTFNLNSGSSCTNGTVRWLNNGSEAGTGTSFTTFTPGNYTATCTIGSCTSTPQSAISITQKSGCGTSGPLANGCYTIKSKLSDKLMQVENNNNGARIRQYGGNGQSNQMFYLEAVDGSYYKITSQSANKIWEAAGAGTNEGTVIQLSDWTDVNHKKWALLDGGSGTYKLQPKHATSRVADVEGGNSNDGNALGLYGPHGGANQAFYFTSAANCSNPPVSSCAGTGTGLTGKYYNNFDVSGSPVFTRTDATINFSWPGSPQTGTVNDDFSVRWEGQIEAPVSGTYTFKTNNDDGTRVWVNNVQIINDWTAHGPTPMTGSITLTACQKYDIKIEFFDSGAGAQSQLLWSYSGQVEQIVPQSRLYPASGTNCTGTGTGLTGKYFNNFDVSGSPVLTRTDATINFSWSGSPQTGTVNDDFSVRWEGQIEAPVSGTYTFKTNNDDGTRVWVNNVQIINDWTAHGPTPMTGSITLTACQKYDIKIEFFDSGVGAQAQLFWSYSGQAEQIVPQSRLYPSSGSGCTTPSPPAITLTSGTTVCAASNQQVTLTATGSGSFTWYRDGTQVGTGTTYTTSQAGSYTAKASSGTCISNASNTVTVTQSSGCGGGTSVTCNGYTFTEGQVIGTTTQGENFVVHFNGNCPSAVSGTNGSAVHFNALTYLLNKTIPDAVLLSCLQWFQYDQPAICSSSCTTPAAPTVNPTSGTVCAATNQQVTLTATGSGIIWYLIGNQVGTGSSFTASQAGSYTAKASSGTCISNASNTVVVQQAANCGSAADCYGLRIVPSQKYVTTKNGPVEVVPTTIGNKEIWQLQDAGGGYYKIVSKASTSNGLVLGVAGQGNTGGNVIELQSSTSGSHQLWKSEEVDNEEPKRYVFQRQNSTLILSVIAYGNGTDDGQPDITLASDDLRVFGGNKFELVSAGGCPN